MWHDRWILVLATVVLALCWEQSGICAPACYAAAQDSVQEEETAHTLGDITHPRPHGTIGDAYFSNRPYRL